jgi:hypothetical protein
MARSRPTTSYLQDIGTGRLPVGRRMIKQYSLGMQMHLARLPVGAYCLRSPVEILRCSYNLHLLVGAWLSKDA